MSSYLRLAQIAAASLGISLTSQGSDIMAEPDHRPKRKKPDAPSATVPPSTMTRQQRRAAERASFKRLPKEDR